MPVQVFDSMEDASAEVKEFQLTTNTRFTSCWSSKNFGLVQDIKSQNHKVHFYESPESNNVDVIPYVIMGNKWMSCHRGKRWRLKSVQAKIRTRPIQYSRKIGCSAGIILRDIMTFPDFKIKADSKHFRREGSKVLRSAISENRAEGVRKIIIQFPDPTDHCPECITKAAGVAMCVDERIVRQIQVYKSQGVESVFEMQKKLREFVRKVLYGGTKPPAPSDRRFFPTRVDIRNAMLVPGQPSFLDNYQENPPDNPQPGPLQTEKLEMAVVTESAHPSVPNDHQYGERLVPKAETECMYVTTNTGVVAQVIIEEMVSAMDTRTEANQQTVETAKVVSELFHNNDIVNQVGPIIYNVAPSINTSDSHPSDQQFSSQMHQTDSQTYHNPGASHTLITTLQATPHSYQVPLQSNHLTPQPYHTMPPQSNQMSQQTYHLPIQNDLMLAQNPRKSAQSYPIPTEAYQVSSQSHPRSPQTCSSSIHYQKHFAQSNPGSSISNQVSELSNQMPLRSVGHGMVSLIGNQGGTGSMGSTMVSPIDNQVPPGAVEPNMVSSAITNQMSSVGNQVSAVRNQVSEGHQIPPHQMLPETSQISVGTYEVSNGGHLVHVGPNQALTGPNKGPNQKLSTNVATSTSSNEISSERSEVVKNLNPIAASCVERLEELKSLTYKVREDDVLKFMLDYLNSLTEELQKSLGPKKQRNRQSKKRSKSRNSGKSLKRKANKGEVGRPKKSKSSTENALILGPMKTTARLMKAGQLVISDKDTQSTQYEIKEEVEVSPEPKRPPVRGSRWFLRRRVKAGATIAEETSDSETVPSADKTQTENIWLQTGLQPSEKSSKVCLQENLGTDITVPVQSENPGLVTGSQASEKSSKVCSQENLGSDITVPTQSESPGLVTGSQASEKSYKVCSKENLGSDITVPLQSESPGLVTGSQASEKSSKVCSPENVGTDVTVPAQSENPSIVDSPKLVSQDIQT